MLASHIVTVLASAAGNERIGAPSSHAPWDVLYVTIGLTIFCLIIAALGETLRARERRREALNENEEERVGPPASGPAHG